MKVAIFEVLRDNYSYLLFNKETAISIDPVDYKLINLALSKDLSHLKIYNFESLNLQKNINQRELLYSITTHHHKDHSGGNEELKKIFPNTKFTKKEEQLIKLENCTIQFIHTPCHTKDSVCIYFISTEKYLFTGDTLFFLGCGRFFEGDSEDMSKSLKKLIKLVNDDTILLYGHNYNSLNAKFASKMHYLPEYLLVKKFLTFKEEKQFNPFLKVFNNSDELGKLRKEKDEFGLGSGK